MTTLATLLRSAIESWADDLRQKTALGTLARQGKLPPRALALYLESLRFLFINSQLNLAAASVVSQNLGQRELAEYFASKAKEEIGHDRWAIEDLSRLPDAAIVGVCPSPAIVSLVEWQRSLIAQHPVCFVAYAVWAEYFTVLLGDEWLESLAASGYERGQVSAITKHLLADRDHAARGFADIDRLWHGEPAAGVILHAVGRAGEIFEHFCDEICGEAARAA
jgi:hypothetical protein